MQVYASLQNGTSGRLRQDKDYKLARVGAEATYAFTFHGSKVINLTSPAMNLLVKNKQTATGIGFFAKKMGYDAIISISVKNPKFGVNVTIMNNYNNVLKPFGFVR